MTPFDIGADAPRGAEAHATSDTLEVSWPASTVTLRLMLTLLVAGGGIALALLFGHRLPGVPLEVTILLALFGGGTVGALGSTAWLSGARVVLRVSPMAVAVETRGAPLGARCAVARSEVRDVLIIEEQDGETKGGRPIMVHRLVAPLVGGGRRVLVGELASASYGHFAEDCFAKWVKR